MVQQTGQMGALAIAAKDQADQAVIQATRPRVPLKPLILPCTFPNVPILAIHTSATPEAINSGQQTVRVGGILTYNDGFPNTPPRTTRFCTFDIWDAKAKAVAWGGCDPGEELDTLIRTVGYPQNEEKPN